MNLDFKIMEQEELNEYARTDSNMNSQDFKVEDFNWSFVVMSINELLEKNLDGNDKKEWLKWLEEEQKGRLLEWGYDSIKQISEYWLDNPEKEPIIAARTTERKIEIWGGFHRFGIAIRNNLDNVPVVFGEIKQ